MPRKTEQLKLFQDYAEPSGSVTPTPGHPSLSPPAVGQAIDRARQPLYSRTGGVDRSQTRTLLTTPPPSFPPGARWREIQLGEHHVGYVLQRSRRKSIGLVVNDDGLQVTAPPWVTSEQIENALVKKSRWVLEKLRWLRERQEHLAIADASWKDGGTVPYIGVPITLRLSASPSHQYLGNTSSPDPKDVLNLALPAEADPTRVRESVYAWMQTMARTVLGSRLQHFVNLSGHNMKKWRLSSANTRWGSCNSDGHIMLNWRLIHFSYDIIDYVVAHEVAHLKHLNHSKEFWREVERLLPDFQEARNALRRHVPGSLPLL